MCNKEEIVVSVVCVTYNHEKYIRHALDSILMQETSFGFEILIGEDCSTDATKTILQEYEARYPKRFRMFYRDKNLGATLNEYELFMNAKGKYIAALELDDIWITKDKLQKQYDFLELHQEYIGVSHDFSIIDKNGNVIENSDNKAIKEFFNRDFTLENFLQQGFIFQTGTHFYRNIFRDGRDYTVIYKAHTLIRDLTILSILLDRGNFYILPDCMSSYRRFFDENAINGRNVTTENLAQDYYNTARQLQLLDEYFTGRVDYSIMRHRLVYGYLKGLLQGSDHRYRWKVFNEMYRDSNQKTKKMIRVSLIHSILRKFKK